MRTCALWINSDNYKQINILVNWLIICIILNESTIREQMAGIRSKLTHKKVDGMNKLMRRCYSIGQS